MSSPVKWSVNAKCAPAVFRRYIDINMKRGLEEIMPGEIKTVPLYIVCSGPSLRETVHELTDKTGKRKGHIWALNAAFDWLCKNGIRPDEGICLAPENAILHYFQEVQGGDKFLFASQVHAELVDRVLGAGASIKLWHSAQPDDWNLPLPKGQQIFGAGTIGLRVFDLAWVLGWRDIHVLGLDGCLSADDRIAVDTPMYDDRRDDLRTFICNGRAFVALPSHARQAEDFSAVVRPLTGMNITLYGDGLIQWAQYDQSAATAA